MSYDYTVYAPSGRAIMGTAYPSLRYPPEIEANMLSLGYKITINGKRLTKKEAAENLAKPKPRRGK